MRRSFSSQEDLRRDQARRVEYLVKEGRRLNEMCDSAGAVNAFRQAVAIRPNDAILLVCLSKSLSDQVFTEEVFHDHALARALSSEAAAISEEAVALKPTYAEAHLSLGAALGRLSMWSDNREKVELSRSIKERCEEAIRLDPESDLALHVLARRVSIRFCIRGVAPSARVARLQESRAELGEARRDETERGGGGVVERVSKTRFVIRRVERRGV